MVDFRKKPIVVLLLLILIGSTLLDVFSEIRAFAASTTTVSHEVSVNEAGREDTIIYTLTVTIASQVSESGYIKILDTIDDKLEVLDTFVPKIDVKGTKTAVGTVFIDQQNNNVRFDLIDQQQLAGKTFDVKVYAKFKDTAIDQDIAMNKVAMTTAPTPDGVETDISADVKAVSTDTKLVDPSQWTVTKQRIDPSGGTSVAGDEDVTYALSFKRDKGTSALKNPVLEDVIPPGAIVKQIGQTDIVNNQPTKTGDFDYQDGKIRWTIPEVAAGVEQDIPSSRRTVVLNYPLATFKDQTVKNIANLYDGKTKLDSDDVTDTVKDGGEVSLLEVKKIAQTDVAPVDAKEVQPGGYVTWEFDPIAVEGPSRKAKLLDFTLTDEVPSDMNPISITTGKYTNLDVPNHPYTISYFVKKDEGDEGIKKTLKTDVSSSTSEVLSIPEEDRASITAIYYEFGQVSPGFKAETSPKIRMRVSESTKKAEITNKAYVTYKLGENTRVTTGGGIEEEDGFIIRFNGAISVGAPKTLLCLKKELVTKQPNIQKGDELEFSISLKNVTEVASDFAKPVLIDVLPDNLSYVAGSARVTLPGQSEEPVEPTGTGKLLFDVSKNNLKQDEEIIVTFKTKVEDERQVQQANDAYAGSIAETESSFSASNCGDAKNEVDTKDLDKDGKTDDRLIKDSVSFQSNIPIVSVEKKEDPQGDKIVKSALPAGRFTNSKAPYILTATNESKKEDGIERGDDMKHPILIDVLPKQLLYNASYTPTFIIERNGGTKESVTPTISYDKSLSAVRYLFEDVILQPGDRIIGNVQYDVGFARAGKITNKVLFTTNDSPIYKGEKGKLELESGKDYSGGVATEAVAAESGYYILDEYQLFETEKAVKGQLDSAFIKGDGKEKPDAAAGSTIAGGSATYRLLMENNGTVREKVSVLMDTLPTIGDKDILTGDARKSEFDFTLLSVASPKVNGQDITSPYSLEYTTSQPDKDGNSTWTKTKPSPFSDVVAFRIQFDTPVTLEPGEKIEVSFDGVADKMAETGQYAYNAFHVKETVQLSTGRETTTRWNTPLKVALKVVGNPAGAYSLGDIIFWDKNRNGKKEADEQGVDGVSVTLLQDGKKIAETLTNNGGTYRFGNLPNGTYELQVEKPTGLAFTNSSEKDPLAVDNDSDASKEGLITGIVIDGKDQDEVDAGLIGLNVGDVVFYDENGNGIQDGGSEIGIPDVKVELMQGTTIVNATTTDTDGKYLFTTDSKDSPLKAGKYEVRFTKPNGYIGFTRRDKGGDDEKDSDVAFTKGATATTASYDLAAGDENLSIDAGLFKGATVGDYVWFDANKNGKQDAGEAPFAGVKVNLQEKQGANYTPVPGTSEVTTDSNGQYTFTNVIPGKDYRVVFNLLAANVIATKKGSTDDGATDANDSDANIAGETELFDLAVNEDKKQFDLGVVGGEIGDYVFYDKNADGRQDDEETGISGIKVELLKGSTLVSTQVTKAGGSYLFTQEGTGTSAKPLLGGAYTVRFTLQDDTYSGFTKTTVGTADKDSNVSSGVKKAGTATVSIARGEINKTIDAGLFKGVTIGDYVWFDANHDGIQDPEEKGVSGLTVRLEQEDAGTFKAVPGYPSVMTDSDGKYSFKDVIPGSKYRVVFDIDAIKAIATKQDQQVDDAKDSDINASGQTKAFELLPETNDLTLDAGIHGIEIGDYIFEDRNGDGIQDDGETGLKDIELNLFDSNNTLVATTQTDADGAYRFTQKVDGSLLPYGSYRIELVLPNGKVLTQSNVGDDDRDSDFDPTSKTVDVTFSKEVATAGEGWRNMTIDGGVITLSSFYGRTWFDQNRDGKRDDTEPLLSGMSVELFNKAGTKVGSTVTDELGLYRFEGLLPNDYYVKFSPGLYQPTQAGVGDADRDSDFDVNANAYGQSGIVTIRSNELNVDRHLDAGFLSAKIGDYIFEDIDADGIQSLPDKAVAGAKVRLLQNDIVVSEVTSNADGSYVFDRMNDGKRPLATGNYVIEVVKPEGFNYFTRRDLGNDDTKDSDVRRSNGQTLPFAFDSAADRLDIDAGLLKDLKGIGDHVFFDENRNGIQDEGEMGLAGVKVTLKEIGEGDTVISTQDTMTDASGNYLFEDLPGGDYRLEFMLPEGYQFTNRDVGDDDTKDSDVAVGGNPLNGMVDVRLGEKSSDLTIDAGVLSGSIGDFVFEDSDYDGIQDANEPGIANRLVTLERKAGETFEKVSDVRTDAEGKYLFRHLPNGTYRIRVDTSDYLETKRFVGGDINRDSNLSSGVTDDVTIDGTNAALSDPRHMDAGLFRPASVTGVIWLDAYPKDGLRQMTERLLAGTTVTLVDTEGQPVKNVDGKNVSPIQVGMDGRYSFTDLYPGVYTVKTSREEFVAYLDATVQDETKNADFIPQSDLFKSQVTVTLRSNENKTDIDAAFIGSTVTGIASVDQNADGIREATDPRLAQVPVELYRDGSRVAQQMTDGTGNYRFTDLPAGTYEVRFPNTKGYLVTRPNVGDDTRDSDAVMTNGVYATGTFPVAAGVDSPNHDIGLYNLASIGGLAWVDLNRDGVRQSTEYVLADATVELFIGDTTTPIATQQTKSDGTYLFSGLMPGTSYRIEIKHPTYRLTEMRDVGDDEHDSDFATVNGTNGGRSNLIYLSSGSGVRHVDAGYIAGSLGDRIWLDANANGVQDTGEAGIPNVRIHLTDGSGRDVRRADGSTVLPIMTDTNGNYRFDYLPAGSYELKLELSEGVQVSPVRIGDTTKDSDFNLSGIAKDISLESGQQRTDVDGGLYGFANVGDRAFIDLNRNGMQDAGERGLSNVKVTLYRGIEKIATVVTDKNGDYRFSQVSPGEYRIVFEKPNGYEFTLMDKGSDDSDSDVNNAGETMPFVLKSGETRLNVDAGFIPDGTGQGDGFGIIGDRVWLDTDGDAMQSPADVPLANVKVILYDATGQTLLFETRTDASGLYRFGGLPAGEYQIRVEYDAKKYVTVPAFSGKDSKKDSNINAAGTSGLIKLDVQGESVTKDLTIDAGVKLKPAFLGSIGKRVWLDLNKNGLFDKGEPVMKNIEVTLYRFLDGKRIKIGTIRTDEDGDYLFEGLQPGDYQVVFEIPDGYVITKPNVNPATGSDAKSNGTTGTISIGINEDNLDIWAGLYPDEDQPPVTPNPDDEDGVTPVDPNTGGPIDPNTGKPISDNAGASTGGGKGKPTPSGPNSSNQDGKGKDATGSKGNMNGEGLPQTGESTPIPWQPIGVALMFVGLWFLRNKRTSASSLPKK